MKSFCLLIVMLLSAPALAYDCYILKNDDRTPINGWAGYVGEMISVGGNAYVLNPKGADDGTPYLGGIRDGIVSIREGGAKKNIGRIDGDRLLSLENGAVLATIDSEQRVTSSSGESMGFARGDGCAPGVALAGVAISYFNEKCAGHL